MSESTTSKVRGQVRMELCGVCGLTKRFYQRGICSACDQRRRRQRQVGTCCVCQREGQILRSRGRCGTCEQKTPQLGEDRRNRVELTDEQVAAGTARRQDYIERVYPVVQRVAWYRGRHLDYHRREERVAEAIALSWQLFCQLVARGTDPISMAAHLAEQCVYRTRAGRSVTGHRDSEDPLSPIFRRYHQDVRLSRGDVIKVVRARRIEQIEIEVREWIRRLPQLHAEVAEFISSGNSWADAQVRFCLDRHAKTRMVEELQASWNVYCQE